MSEPENSLRERIRRLTPGQREQLAAALRRRSKQRLIAYVQASRDADIRNLKDDLRSRLPAFMIPALIIPLQAFPRLPNGKTDHACLPAPTAINAPVETRSRGNEAALHEPALHEPAMQEPAITEVQRRLLLIWQEVLGFEEISVHDDFFEIGGDSLLMIQFLSRARASGFELSPNDLAEEATIIRIAEICEHRTGRQHNSSIHLIRDGDEPGSVLFVHDIGGDIGYAKNMIGPFASKTKVFVARQSQDSESHHSIEEMASTYIRQWVSQDADGPYSLIAYCWGGIIGYEIARQLRDQDRPIGSLGIIESRVDKAFDFAPPAERCLAWGRGLKMRAIARLRDALNVRSGRDLVRVIPGRIRTRFGWPLETNADSETQWQPSEQYVSAYYAYDIQPSNLSLNLFRVRKVEPGSGKNYVDRTYGWKFLVGDQLQVHFIPGDHFSCTEPPHCEGLVQQINQVFNE